MSSCQCAFLEAVFWAVRRALFAASSLLPPCFSLRLFCFELDRLVCTCLPRFHDWWQSARLNKTQESWNDNGSRENEKENISWYVYAFRNERLCHKTSYIQMPNQVENNLLYPENALFNMEAIILHKSGFCAC